MTKKLKITQVRSRIGSQRGHVRTLEALGIKRNNITVYRSDTPAVRGMLNRISHLVSWEEVDGKNIPEKEKRSSGVTVISESEKAEKRSKEPEEKSD